MSTPAKRVFFIGSTGYVGGTVLQKLLAQPDPAVSHFTFLIRDAKKAERVSQIPLPAGVTASALIGTLQDTGMLTQAAEDHDVVVQVADADDVEAMAAILEGMKRRKAKTGETGVLIHTSGTGLFMDDARGEHASDSIYTDLDAAGSQYRSFSDLPDQALHRNVDLAILAADKAGDIKSYIVVPPTIWGEAKGPLYDIGYSKTSSIQIPLMIRISLDRKRAGFVGKGANIWNHVSLSDVGDLFTLVFAGALRGDVAHGESGLYLATAGDYTLSTAMNAVGAELVRLGLADSAEATTLNDAEMNKYFGGAYWMGTNARGVSDRSRSIGWAPKDDKLEDFLRDVQAEVSRVVKAHGTAFP